MIKMMLQNLAPSFPRHTNTHYLQNWLMKNEHLLSPLLVHFNLQWWRSLVITWNFVARLSLANFINTIVNTMIISLGLCHPTRHSNRIEWIISLTHFTLWLNLQLLHIYVLCLSIACLYFVFPKYNQRTCRTL